MWGSIINAVWMLAKDVWQPGKKMDACQGKRRKGSIIFSEHNCVCLTRQWFNMGSDDIRKT